VPLICIPTSLSGGEYFSLAGGTDDATHHKQAFMQPGMGSKLVILDAALSIHTPAFYWLSTGIRGVDHCVETICSLQATEETDKNARTGLRLLVPSLLRSKEDEKDVDARHQSQMGVILAMNGVRSGVPVGGSHAIGHQLGPLGVPHGVTSCIMLPQVFPLYHPNILILLH
jgi:alcohol dehydrogenase class IV